MRWFLVTLALLLLPAPASADVGQARRQYNRLWNHYIARDLGRQGQPPPQVVWTPYAGDSHVNSDGAPGQRPIYLNGMDRKMLKNPTLRFIAQRDVAHEARHVFQDLSHYDPTLPHDQRPEEQDADQFAGRVVRQAKKGHRQQLKRAAKKRV